MKDHTFFRELDWKLVELLKVRLGAMLLNRNQLNGAKTLIYCQGAFSRSFVDVGAYAGSANFGEGGNCGPATEIAYLPA